MALFAILAGLLGQLVGFLTGSLSPPARRNARWALGLLTAILFFLAQAVGGEWVRVRPGPLRYRWQLGLPDRSAGSARGLYRMARAAKGPVARFGHVEGLVIDLERLRRGIGTTGTTWSGPIAPSSWASARVSERATTTPRTSIRNAG